MKKAHVRLAIVPLILLILAMLACDIPSQAR